jgi:hypothetical protein
MILVQIQKVISKHKPCSLITVRRYLRKARIKPLGIRQKPQNYPDDSADKILARLGLTPTMDQLRSQATGGSTPLRTRQSQATGGKEGGMSARRIQIKTYWDVFGYIGSSPDTGTKTGVHHPGPRDAAEEIAKADLGIFELKYLRKGNYEATEKEAA